MSPRHFSGEMRPRFRFIPHIKLVLLDIGQAFVRSLLVSETVCLGGFGRANLSGPYRESLTGWNLRNPVRPLYVKHRRVLKLA